jgi:phosphoribosylaminoimidazole-succinocarboxamide synthase
MIDIKKLKMKDFKKLPLVIEGESKEVRYAGKGEVVIRFKPTVYSFTENRCAEIPGSNIPRLRVSKIFVDILKKNGIAHAYKEVTDEFVLADLVMPHEVEFKKYNLKKFVPSDLSQKEIEKLPRAPPIEIVAKRYLTGTTKHGCVDMAGSYARKSHQFYKDMELSPDGALPEIIIRFDWRNPLNQKGKGKRIAEQILSGMDWDNKLVKEIKDKIEKWGDRVADFPLPPQLADLFINIKQAQRTAFLSAKIIEEFLATKNIVFYDLCMFISEDGNLVYGEISPDCGRYRHLDLGSLDKDVWRAGGSSKDIINKWNILYELITTENKK